MNRIKPKISKEIECDKHIKELKEYLENMDKCIQNIIKEIIEDVINDKGKLNTLYLKTDFGKMTYNIRLYSSETKNTVCKSYSLDMLLKSCINEDHFKYEFNKVVRQLILEVESNNPSNNKNNIWIG
ncbi:hypothetical protein U729_3157 (plasmid) [Clostridium baratii str. Sullivan]|uniref:Uncharacterized protein n=1 Tax=Clostridium baratii str. Sullivan TaxID=1415775 RepID=A0A0A7G0H8_9CLOT|nr:hypothetical protein [Clostridium baratii]AIY85322.1 hypothetical protein U729_3157 [Clostridium baratii str. Sullivan]